MRTSTRIHGLAAAAVIAALAQAACQSTGGGISAHPHRLDRPEQVVIGADRWSGPEDCSAGASIRRTDDALVVTIAVRDDALVGSAGDPWEGDSVEIYLDLRPEAQRDGSYASGVFQMVIAPALAPEAKTTYSFHVGENAFHIPDVRGTVVLSALTDGGYQVTVSFPLEELARTHLPLGESLAFDIGVNDADDAGRESQLMLFGTADNWTSTRGFHSIAP